MWKKAVVLAMMFCLALSPVAFAAGSETTQSVLTPKDGLQYQVKLLFEKMRLGFSFGPAAKARMYTNMADERLKELEALQASDPEALKQKLLEQHDKMVAKAQTIIDTKANLPQDIINRVVESQAKAVERATQEAANAKDPNIAQKRLAYVKAKQELMLANVEKNAPQIAEKMIARAQAVLDNTASVRARIENGEGLQVVKERMQQRLEQVKQRRQQWLKNHPK